MFRRPRHPTVELSARTFRDISSMNVVMVGRQYVFRANTEGLTYVSVLTLYTMDTKYKTPKETAQGGSRDSGLTVDGNNG